MFALGIMAALTSPLVMNVGFIIWQDHWKGSAFSLNLFKCNLASVGFLVLSCATGSRQNGNVLFASNVFTTEAVGYMILSGMIGIVIGDWAWLRGLQLLGARRTILLDSIKPFLASLLGYLILGEKLRLAALAGIVATVAGVILVSFERTASNQLDNEVQDDFAGTANVSQESNMCSSGSSSPQNNEDGETSKDNDACGMHGIVEPASSVIDGYAKEIDATNDHNIILSGTVINSVDRIAINSTDGSQSSEDVEKITPSKGRTPGELKQGYVLSLLNAGLDTYGAVLTKQYGVGMTVWEINLIRFGFAGLSMLLLSILLTFWTKAYKQHLPPSAGRDASMSNSPSQPNFHNSPTRWFHLPVRNMHRSNWFHVTGGVVLVTFAAPTLFNYALFQIALALTLTLTSVGPLYSLPLEYIFDSEKRIPSWKAIVGAILAVFGIVVLALWGPIPDE